MVRLLAEIHKQTVGRLPRRLFRKVRRQREAEAETIHKVCIAGNSRAVDIVGSPPAIVRSLVAIRVAWIAPAIAIPVY